MNRIHASLVLALAISPGTACADLVFSRDDLGADDNIQWGQFGPPRTVVPSPSMGLSDMGRPFTVSNIGDLGLVRFDEGDGAEGNFAVGDELIWNGQDFGGAVIVDFDAPVFGVGANIQENFFGPFTGVIEVFDADGDLIERFTREGESNAN